VEGGARISIREVPSSQYPGRTSQDLETTMVMGPS
jgi:hypothetical protein